MSDSFKAIVINQSGEKFTREVKSIEKSFFKTWRCFSKSRLFRFKL